MDKSVFQRSALASGLLTQSEIEEALAALGSEKVDKTSELKPSEKASEGKSSADERLGNKLVEMGRLNRWQAEQLRNGRTKFNLGPYQIIDAIGQGGMGHVFKAEHTVMGRVVAIKVLPRNRATPETIASFIREIRTQAQLDHENLVRAYDAGHDGNVHFLATEYVPGTDLRKLIRSQGKLAVNLAASIITQAARGLDHAHARGLIHRDVKPGNLLVTPEGRTKVSDLGLAGYFNESEQEDAYGGKVVGTADYLAPEQITSPDKLTPAADVYALGCTLYYAVTAKVPFPGGTAREKARKHINLPPLDPRRLNHELSDDFVELVAEMMAKRPEQRVQTMADVALRLAPWVGAALPRAAEDLVALVPPSPPPIRIPPVMRHSPSPMSETEPYFLVQPAEEPGQGESPSQVSQGTQPMAGHSQETIPVPPEVGRVGLTGEIMNAEPATLMHRWEALSPKIRLAIFIGIAAAVGAVTTLVLHSLLGR